MNRDKGVSMIMLVITIAMMAIIVSFAVYSSRNITPESKLAAAYSSLKAVKDSCDNAENLIEINPSEYDYEYFFGQTIQELTNDTELNNIAQKCGLASSSDFSKNTYIIKNSDSENDKRILEKLELKGVSEVYIVDLDNDNYFILNGTERTEGQTLYEYRDILKAYNMLVN